MCLLKVLWKILFTVLGNNRLSNRGSSWTFGVFTQVGVLELNEAALYLLVKDLSYFPAITSHQRVNRTPHVATDEGVWHSGVRGEDLEVDRLWHYSNLIGKLWQPKVPDSLISLRLLTISTSAGCVYFYLITAIPKSGRIYVMNIFNRQWNNENGF